MPSFLENVDEQLLWREHPLLGCVDPDVQNMLRRRYPVTRVDADRSLARAGEPVDEVCFLLAGAVRVYQEAMDEREVLSRIVEAPGVIGDAEVLQRVSHARSAQTLEPCLVVAIPAPDFERLLQKFPEMMRAELNNLSGLCCLGARNELAVLGSLEERIANVLLAYARRYGRPLDDGSVLIEAPLSLKVIARSVGGVWRSVGHVLSGLRKKGLVGKREDMVVIPDPRALEDLAALVLGGLNFRAGMSLPRGSRRRPPSAEVRVTAGPACCGGQQILVEEEIVIGREPPVDLLVTDARVCPRHARVFRSPTGNRYWIQDLQSESGTRINGEPVRRALLHDGDRIEVGRTELVFRITTDVADASVSIAG